MLGRYVFALAPLGAAALWGGMYVVSKWGFGYVPPLTLGFLRVVIGATALLAVHGRVDVDAADYPRIATLGVLVTLTIATQFVGTDLTTASQGALLTVLTPVFTVLLGAALLGESLTARKLGGVIVAAVGTVVVVAGQYDLATITGGHVAGVLALVFASLAWAGYTVWGLPLVRRYSALTAATYATVAAVPMLGVLAAGELVTRGLPETLLSLEAVAAVLYLGLFSTAAAWYLWYKGIEYVDAGTVSVFFFAQPVVGGGLGAVLFGDPVGVAFGVGAALLAVGVWTVSSERPGPQ